MKRAGRNISNNNMILWQTFRIGYFMCAWTDAIAKLATLGKQFNSTLTTNFQAVQVMMSRSAIPGFVEDGQIYLVSTVYVNWWTKKKGEKL